MPARRNGNGRLPRLLSVKAISEATSIPGSTIYGAITAGDLAPVHRIGRAVRVEEAVVKSWLDRCREATP